MGGPVRVRELLVPKVDIVRPKVGRPKRRVVRHRKARCAAARQGGVEGWANGEHAGVDIVAVLVAADVGSVEPDLDIILGSLVVAHAACVGPALRGQVGLAEQVERAGAGDVELLVVAAGGDEDVVRGRVVWEGQDGALDRGKVGAGVVGAHKDGAVGTALQRIGRLLLALGKGGRRIGSRGVAVCQGWASEAQGEQSSQQGGGRAKHVSRCFARPGGSVLAVFFHGSKIFRSSQGGICGRKNTNCSDHDTARNGKGAMVQLYQSFSPRRPGPISVLPEACQ